jgi:hypothetical protein
MDDIFSNVPALDQEGREKWDAPLTITELTTALQNSNSGRSPGLEGLTYELFLLRVANTSMQQKKLPTFTLNGIIALIHKKGQLRLLSNK